MILPVFGRGESNTNVGQMLHLIRFPEAARQLEFQPPRVGVARASVLGVEHEVRVARRGRRPEPRVAARHGFAAHALRHFYWRRLVAQRVARAHASIRWHGDERPLRVALRLGDLLDAPRAAQNVQPERRRVAHQQTVRRDVVDRRHRGVDDVAVDVGLVDAIDVVERDLDEVRVFEYPAHRLVERRFARAEARRVNGGGAHEFRQHAGAVFALRGAPRDHLVAAEEERVDGGERARVARGRRDGGGARDAAELALVVFEEDGVGGVDEFARALAHEVGVVGLRLDDLGRRAVGQLERVRLRGEPERGVLGARVARRRREDAGEVRVVARAAEVGVVGELRQHVLGDAVARVGKVAQRERGRVEHGHGHEAVEHGAPRERVGVDRRLGRHVELEAARLLAAHRVGVVGRPEPRARKVAVLAHRGHRIHGGLVADRVEHLGGVDFRLSLDELPRHRLVTDDFQRCEVGRARALGPPWHKCGCC